MYGLVTRYGPQTSCQDKWLKPRKQAINRFVGLLENERSKRDMLCFLFPVNRATGFRKIFFYAQGTKSVMMTMTELSTIFIDIISQRKEIIM